MSSEYSAVKGGKLRLKGGDKIHKKKRKRKRDQAGELDYADGELKHGEALVQCCRVALFPSL